MQGARFRLDGMRGKAALGLLALALMFRVLIPVGWMPTTGSGFAITLCTGMGAVTAWVDKDGHTNKEKPAQESTGHPCTFSGFSEIVRAHVLTPVTNAHLACRHPPEK